MILRLLYYYFKTQYLSQCFRNREQLSAYQEKGLKTGENTLGKSPFYQPYLDKPFIQWPIINKK